jgi:RIO kinase 1
MTSLPRPEKFKIIKGVFDPFTNRVLFELSSRGYFEELVSPLAIGKESNVFLASTRENKTVVVKIYRIENCDFKRMYDYLKQDPRYMFLKDKHREIVLAWAQREYKNLMRAAEAKILAPRALAWRSNVLVEELVGEKEPAPRLKDNPPKKATDFFKKVVQQMRSLYQYGLIHGDLSAFNILNFREKPYFIDFSQATLTKAPNSGELLWRDIGNVVQFFRKCGIEADPELIFKEIVKK